MAGPDESGPDARPSTLVVEAVAAAEDVDETDLPPLNDVTDPDALDALCAPRRDGSDRVGCLVAFEYVGYTVTVDKRGRVELAE